MHPASTSICSKYAIILKYPFLNLFAAESSMTQPHLLYHMKLRPMKYKLFAMQYIFKHVGLWNFYIYFIKILFDDSYLRD